MNKIIVHDTHPSLETLLKHLHFDSDSEQADIAEELLDEAKQIAAPKTLFSVLPVTLNEETITIGDVEITYPYVRKMLYGNKKAVAFIATCGTELEEWSLGKKSDPLEEFVADAIKLDYLAAARKPFRDIIKDEVFPEEG